MVVPERHNKHHTRVHAPAHRCHATPFVERVNIFSKNLLLIVAPLLGDTVASHAISRLWVLEHLTVLDVESLDLAELVARAKELCNDSHLLVGVELLAFAVEVLYAHAEWVEVTAIGIT